MSIFALPVIGDPLAALGMLPPERAIGSLWRRFVALFIDAVILGVAGVIVALPFFNAFSRLGAWGPLVGMGLALPYFAILNSSIGNGQTLGKRLMHLQVVDKNGSTISFGRSVARYMLFAIAYYLDELSLPTTRTPWLVSTLISIISFGVGGATLYLVIFNRHTRQALHDLVVGSYVADADKAGPLKLAPIWKFHWAILSFVLVALFLGSGVLKNKMEKWGPFPQLLEDVRLIEAMNGVQVAGVQDLTAWNNDDKKKILVINVRWTGQSDDEPAFADQVAKVILEDDLKVKEYDRLRVVMIRGYYIGIAHAQISHSYEHTPDEWSARLFGTSPAETPAPAKPY